MTWTAHQRVMLREMGIGAFWPEVPLDAPVDAAVASPAGRGGCAI